MKAGTTVPSSTEVTSWTDMLEEESLYLCSCDVDVNNSSFSTTSSSSHSSVFDGGSSEITEVEECALSTAPTLRLGGPKRAEVPYEGTEPPEESKDLISSDILSEEWVKKSRETANICHVGTQLERIKKKLDISTGRLREIYDISALMQVKVMEREPNEVDVKLYSSKGTDHRSTHEGDNFEKLNLSHLELSSKALAFLDDATSEQSFSSEGTNRLMLKGKKAEGEKDEIAVGKHSAIKKDGPFVQKSETLDRSKDEYHQTECVKALDEAFANSFQKSAGLSTNACENHVPDPTLTRATELTRDYEIIVRESSHERQRYFVCLMDKKQGVAMEKPPSGKKGNNPKSILNKNRELVNACLHTVGLGKNCEDNILNEFHAIHQKGPFADKIATCFENSIEEISQANRGFLKISQSSEPLEGELQPNFSFEASFDSFEEVLVKQISDSISKYPSSVEKGKSEDTTNGHPKEPFCTLIEISDDSVAFLPELLVENVRVSPPGLKHIRSSSAEIEVGKSCVADNLKVLENPTQIPECIIIYENSDVADARGWHPSIYSIPNTEKHLVETCAEYSHDLCGIHVKVTEPQGVDVIIETHLVGLVELSEYLRVMQPFCNVGVRSFKCSADFSEGEIYRRCAIKTPISPRSSEPSGLLQGGDTVREGIIEPSSENHYQNTATASQLAELGQYISKKSKKSQKASECSFHCTSQDSDGFGDVEDGFKKNEKNFIKSNHICHILGTSSSVDGVQASLEDNDENCDSNTTQVEHPEKVQFANSTSDYTVASADQPGENVKILETASPITKPLEAVQVEKHVVLELPRRLNRVCQKLLIIEEEVIEIADVCDEKLPTNSTIPPLSLVDIRSKPDIHINQMIVDFFDEKVDSLCFLNLTGASGSLVMSQGTFQKEAKTARNTPKTIFPELVGVIPLQEMPEFVSNYKLLNGVQEKPKNASKTKGIKSSSLISTNTRDGLTECTESEETNPVVVDDDSPAQNAAKMLEHLDRLADFSFKLEHPSAAKKSMQNSNPEESDFLLCWRAAPPISRQKCCQPNLMKIFGKNQSEYILSHDGHVVSRLRARRPFPSATFKNPSGGGGGGGGGGEAHIRGKRVQPLVLMGGFEPDSARTIATPSNEYSKHTHSAFYTRQNERLNSRKRETVSTRQRSREETVRITSPSTKQGPKTGSTCKNPLDLLILDTISSISEHNAIDSNGNASSDMRLLLQSERYKGLVSIWWKKYGLNN